MMKPTTALPVSTLLQEGIQLQDILQDINTRKQTMIYADKWQKNPTKINPDLHH